MTEPQEPALTPESTAEPPIDVVPFVRRKLAWDMIPHDEIMNVLPLLGLTPASEEGLETEHLDSHMRTLRVGYIIERVRVYSVLSAEILGCSLMRNDAEHHITDAQRAQFDWQNSVVINTAACAIIAQFIDDGLLAPTAPA